MLGELIRAWREKHGKSLRELAEIIGVDPTAIHRLENGHDVSCRVLALIFCWILDRQ